MIRTDCSLLHSVSWIRSQIHLPFVFIDQIMRSVSVRNRIGWRWRTSQTEVPRLSSDQSASRRPLWTSVRKHPSKLLLQNGNRCFSTTTDAAENAEKKKEERERIMKELGRMMLGGTLYDVRAASKNENSKVFPTEVITTPFDVPQSLRSFSALSGKTLSLPVGSRPSALLVAFNQLGWSMLEDWRKALVSLSVPTVQLSVVEGWSARVFSSSISTSMKQSTPPELHDIVALRTSSFDSEKQALGIDNRAIGYAFIVDATGRVRLRGCGKFIEEDRTTLKKCLGDLRNGK